MADAKISALTEVTAPSASDVLPIVNASTTKKVQASNLVNAILPDQTTASGQYLTSNGSAVSWAAVSSGSGDIKADGSVDFTAVVAYNADKTFTTDQDIVSKKYVDDAIVAAGGYTDEQAQDAVGSILTDSASIDFTYTDAAGTITASVIASGVNHDALSGFVANEHIDWTADQGATNIHSGNIPDLSATYAAASHVTASGVNVHGLGSISTQTASAVSIAGSLSGTLSLNEKDIRLVSAPGTDLTLQGITASFLASEALAAMDVGYITSAGYFAKTNASAVGSMPVVGMAMASAAASAVVNCLLHGIARNDAWNWTVGGLMYASTTGGAMTQTAASATGNQVQVLGIATHADRVFFNPQLVLLERA